MWQGDVQEQDEAKSITKTISFLLIPAASERRLFLFVIFSRIAAMSGLRRRIFGTTSADSPSLTPEHSREGTPTSEEVRVVSAKKLQKLTDQHKARGTKRRNAWIFGLGGLFGIIVAGFFASSNEVFDMQALRDMNLDSILDVLPAGLIKDAHELQVGFFRVLVISPVPPLAVVQSRLCSLHIHVLYRKINETPSHTIPLQSACTPNPKA
jgi:hypothetical protein